MINESNTIDMRQFATKIAALEGGAMNLPIAQIAEVIRCTVDEMAEIYRSNPAVIHNTLTARYERNHPAGDAE